MRKLNGVTSGERSGREVDPPLPTHRSGNNSPPC